MPPFAWALAVIGAVGAVVGTVWFGWWLADRRKNKLFDRADVEQIRREIQEVNNKVGRIAEYLDGLPTSPNKKIKDLFQRGMDHKRKYEHTEAIASFRQALGLDPTGSEKAGLLILIGNCFLEQSNYPEAEGHYKEAAAVAEVAEDRKALARTYNNIGEVYRERGDYDKALQWYQKSLKITEDIGDRSGLAASYNNIGSIYKAKGYYDQALGYLQQALALFREIGAVDRARQGEANIEVVEKAKQRG